MAETKTQDPGIDSARAPVPGSEIVGRGLKLVPRSPYELKDFLFERATAPPSKIPESGQPQAADEVRTVTGVFDCPAFLAVQESPPVHQGVSLGKTVILESSDKLDSLYTLNRKVAASFGAFSISAGGDYSKSVTSSRDSYFAVRTSFIPLWSLYMPSPDLGTNFRALREKLEAHPEHFSEPARWTREVVTQRKDYFRSLFEKYGTHYVTRAWVGGKATVNVIVSKASGVSKKDIHDSLSASWGGNASLDMKQTDNRERVRNNSQVVVWGQGGDTPLLAKLADLKDTTYNTWLDSVPKNPQVIELEVKGIWTLFADAESANLAAGLKDAYERATEFSPLRAMVTVDWQPPLRKDKRRAPRTEKILYVLRKGSRYALNLLDVSARPSKKPLYGPRDSPLNRESYFRPIDAAVSLPPARGLEVPRSQNVLYFFSGSEYLIYDPYGPRIELAPGSKQSLLKKSTSKGKEIVEFLAGAEAPMVVDEVMAALGLTSRRAIDTLIERKVVLQKGKTGLLRDRTPIRKGFPDLPFTRVDAAFYLGSNMAYFFHQSQYVRFDTKRWKVEEGYPQEIRDRWDGVPFDSIDAAMLFDGEVYFFKNDAYVVYSLETLTVAAGYPRYLVGSHLEEWEIFR